MGAIRFIGGPVGNGSRRSSKVLLAGLAGALSMVPAAAVHEGVANLGALATEKRGSPGQVERPLTDPSTVSVDGSLPSPPDVADLMVVEPPPSGMLGIPATALKAYRSAARIVRAEFPGCNIDWALLASIGRIESNHARGGYVDTEGNTLEPILGPVLNGVGPVAAIADTDNGRYDGNKRWDRAVGPTQFIPLTWERYGSDGNGDGAVDPNNIYDATVATGRYLCSGGTNLAKPDQLRAALYRYNNSDAYVETVIKWAQAYRDGVASVPDSKVPLAVPRSGMVEAPSPAGVSAGSAGRPKNPGSTPTSSRPPSSGTGSSNPKDPTGSSSSSWTKDPTTTTPDDSDTSSPDESGGPSTGPTDPTCETSTPPSGNTTTSSTTTSSTTTTAPSSESDETCESTEPTEPPPPPGS